MSESFSKTVKITLEEARVIFSTGRFSQEHEAHHNRPLKDSFRNNIAINALAKQAQRLKDDGFKVMHSISKIRKNDRVQEWLNTAASMDGVTVMWKIIMGENTSSWGSNKIYSTRFEVRAPILKVRLASGGYKTVISHDGVFLTTVDRCLEAAKKLKPEKTGQYDFPAMAKFVSVKGEETDVASQVEQGEIPDHHKFRIKHDVISQCQMVSAIVERVSGVNTKGKVIRHSGNPKLAPFFEMVISVLNNWRSNIDRWRILVGPDGYFVVDTTLERPVDDSAWKVQLNNLDRVFITKAIESFTATTFA